MFEIARDAIRESEEKKKKRKGERERRKRNTIAGNMVTGKIIYFYIDHWVMINLFAGGSRSTLRRL